MNIARGSNATRERIRQTVHASLGLLAVMLVSAGFSQAQTAAPAVAQAPPPEGGIAGKTAEHVFRNVQVMRDEPSTSIQGAMLFITEALGVECRFCHSDQFDKDDKIQKQTARKMIQMTRDLNKNSFEGRDPITCYTCHQGRARVTSVPQIPRPAVPPGVTPLPAGAAAPSPEELYVKYEQALGGIDKLAAVRSRVLRGSVSGLSPQAMQAELRQTAGKMSVAMSAPPRTLAGAFNGNEAWMQIQIGPRTLNIITDEFRAVWERFAELYPGGRLRATVSGLRLLGSVPVNGQDAWVVGPAQGTATSDQLFFEKASGLLIRRTYLVPTILGPLSAQIDYEDYRDSGGVKVPFKVMIGRPQGTGLAFTFTGSEPNAALADSVFEAPKP